ncbi:MAG: aminoacyl-tRNA hydrolase [Alphaproteobacteria bacterium]|nr:aminoacyl-tRNA hydrolase [Alphaproteobacteria bacterium]
MNNTKPLLIVGLGNPGAAYTRTRHNVGFMAVDYMAGPGAVWKKEKDALVAKTSGAIFVKPQTFMNLSGRAVQQLMTFYKIPLENLAVIHDELDLPVGAVREKTGGGSAGHNGIRSIDAAVGKEYARIRIGIGHPRDVSAQCCGKCSQIDPADWVLGKFADAELKLINAAIEKLTG